ncbi:hypothetical protein AB0L06_41095 [Spirillospora sp. NPDC052269]
MGSPAFIVFADQGWQDTRVGRPSPDLALMSQASGTWCFDTTARDWATRDANGRKYGNTRWYGPTAQDDTSCRFHGLGARRGQLIGRWGEDGQPFLIGDHAYLGWVGPTPYVPPDAEALRARIGLVRLLADPESGITGDRPLRDVAVIGFKGEVRRLREVVESGREEWRERFGPHMPVPEVWHHAQRAVRRAVFSDRKRRDLPASYGKRKDRELIDDLRGLDDDFLYGAPLQLVSDRPCRPARRPVEYLCGPTIGPAPSPYGLFLDRLPDLDPDPTRGSAKFDLRGGLPWLTQKRIARLEARRDADGRPYRDPEHVAWGRRFIADVRTILGPWTMLVRAAPETHERWQRGDAPRPDLRVSDVVPDMVEIAAKPPVERREALERMIADGGHSQAPPASEHRGVRTLWLAMNNTADGAARGDGQLRITFD